MAILDRKVKKDQVAKQPRPEEPFAEVDAKQLSRAQNHPGVARFAEFSRRYLARLRREERIG